MNYRQTIDYLYSHLPVYHRIGPAAYKSGLDNSLKLAKYFGNPENKFRSIHIAGTNGKGSVSHMLASIFQEAGYKTGLCTSPHLKDFRERFRINGKMISKKFIVNFVNQGKSLFDEIQPSFFEMSIALGFCWFAENMVDVAVIETGLGGRLDSTNIIKPEVSVITNISLDHTRLLGDTHEKIAFEKAGIIKQSTPVAIGSAGSSVREVFVKQANQFSSSLYFAEDNFKIIHETDVIVGNRKFSKLRAEGYGHKSLLYCPLTASYQLENVATVFQSVYLINKHTGFHLNEASVVKGIENVISNTGLLGRWQIIGNHPLIICDTGHNPAGIAEVVKNISGLSYRLLHFVLGMTEDKDIGEILSCLPVKDTMYYFCKPNLQRGLNPEILHVEAKRFGLNGESFPNVKTAFNTAKKNAQKSDLIFVGGSTFVVGEVI